MSFAYPWFLILLWAVPAIAVLYIFAAREKQKRLNAFGDEKLISSLADSLSPRKKRAKIILLVLAALFAFISLAGPRIGSKMEELKRKGVDIFIAIDCSKSMLARDISPSRLSKAKTELSLFVNKLNGDRIGIIAFAGTAFIQCPLTLDYSAANMFMDLIDPSLIPRPGTNLASAIRLAIKSFTGKERKHKVLILLTDGESHEGDVNRAIKEAKEEGVRIYTIGFGNPSGEPISMQDANGVTTGYLKDKNGNVIMSRLDESTLQAMSIETGGKYYRASDGEVEIDRIYEDISSMEKKELQARMYSQRENRYQYFLFIALILLLLETLLSERKGAFIGIFMLILILPLQAGASLNSKINKGNSLYNKGKYEEALGVYRDALIDEPESRLLQFNAGSALYKNGDYESAMQEFSKASYAKDVALQAKSYYNIGNCLYRLEKSDEAINYYKKALDINPDDRDAKYNIELIQKKQKAGIKKCPECDKKEKQDKEKGDKGDKGQEQQDEQKKGDKKDKGEKERQKKEQQGKEDQENKEENSEGAKPEDKKDEISKEDAQRILDAFQGNEEKASKERKKAVIQVVPVEKDW